MSNAWANRPEPSPTRALRCRPVFGCLPHVPDQKQPGHPCPVCGDRITSNALFCAADGCARVSDRNERVLAAERAVATAEAEAAERKQSHGLKAGARMVNARRSEAS